MLRNTAVNRQHGLDKPKFYKTLNVKHGTDNKKSKITYFND